MFKHCLVQYWVHYSSQKVLPIHDNFPCYSQGTYPVTVIPTATYFPISKILILIN